MDQVRTPLLLGDIVEQTVNLTVSTFTRSLIVSALFLTLPFIVITITANEFFHAVLALGPTSGADQEQWQRLLPFLHALIPFILSTFIVLIGTVITQIAITQMAAGDLTGESIGYATAIARTFDRRWYRSIVAEFLKMAVLSAFIAAVVIAMVIIMMLAGGGKTETGTTVITVLFILFLTPVIVAVAVLWNFSLEAVAIEDLTATEALRRSWALVKGYWWRTVGIFFLFGIAVQFITSIISIPFTFGSMWDVYKEFFTIAKEQNGQVDPHLFEQIQGALGTGIGVGMAITTVVRMLIEPQYRTVMYFDLRARHTPASEPVAESVPTVPPTV